MNKKAKKRFLEYRNICKVKFGVEPLRLAVPNITRVAGAYLMFESCLRAYHLITKLPSNTQSYKVEYHNLVPSRKMWDFLAETIAILKIMHQITQQLQSDVPGEIAFAYVAIAYARWKFSSPKHLYEVPLYADKEYCPTTPINEIPPIMMEKKDMSEAGQTLITRLVKEFDK